jgi:hypothetical protein
MRDNIYMNPYRWGELWAREQGSEGKEYVSIRSVEEKGSVTTLNYPVRSGPHYITNDIGSDPHRTRMTYRGVPGARRSCVILQFCIGSYCTGRVPNWGACYD